MTTSTSEPIDTHEAVYVEPLDPDSPKGIATAEAMSAVLAQIRTEIAARKREVAKPAPARRRRAA